MIGMENRKAYLKGYEACEAFILHSVEIPNPYRVGTEKHHHWARGFEDCYNGFD